jgi:hypothetical protein
MGQKSTFWKFGHGICGWPFLCMKPCEMKLAWRGFAVHTLYDILFSIHPAPSFLVAVGKERHVDSMNIVFFSPRPSTLYPLILHRFISSSGPARREIIAGHTPLHLTNTRDAQSQVDLSFLYMQIRQLRRQSNMVDQIVKIMRRLRCYGWRQAGRPKVEVYLMVGIT